MISKKLTTHAISEFGKLTTIYTIDDFVKLTIHKI